MLLIYLPIITARSKYIIELIFKNEFNITYELTTNADIFKAYQQEKLNYSERRIDSELFIYAAPLLSENFIKKVDVMIDEIDQTKVLFPHRNLCDIGFDIFSAVFYMISRYEEYLPFAPDRYGRFKATDSIACKNNFLQMPVVDKWINYFKNILQKKFPYLPVQASTFTSIVTYDVDVAYKFKGRSLVRNAGAIFKDLIKFDVKNIQQRIQTLIIKKKDPWDTYNYLKEIIIKNKLESVFFFLVGGNSSNDRNLDHKNPQVKILVEKIKTFSEIGIHPSFTTSVIIKKIAAEKARLENIAQKKIYKSRQHYLKFILPETYNALLATGICEDYSMGFPEAAGFRAGTSRPFNFYDLKNEKATGLKIFPVTFMDGSYINSKKEIEQIAEDIYNLIEQVKSVNGIFISIWHNHTVSETKEYIPWRNIHDKMIEQLIF